MHRHTTKQQVPESVELLRKMQKDIRRVNNIIVTIIGLVVLWWLLQVIAVVKMSVSS